MILYERKFKRQWKRGKLSRKMKKRMYREIGYCEIPNKSLALREVQLVTLKVHTSLFPCVFKPMVKAISGFQQALSIAFVSPSLRPFMEDVLSAYQRNHPRT